MQHVVWLLRVSMIKSGERHHTLRLRQASSVGAPNSHKIEQPSWSLGLQQGRSCASLAGGLMNPVVGSARWSQLMCGMDEGSSQTIRRLHVHFGASSSDPPTGGPLVALGPAVTRRRSRVATAPAPASHCIRGWIAWAQQQRSTWGLDTGDYVRKPQTLAVLSPRLYTVRG